MCIVTEEIEGTVALMQGDYLAVIYDHPMRVQTGSIFRTVFSGRIGLIETPALSVGDRVICQVQRVGSHNDEPLIAVRKSRSSENG